MDERCAEIRLCHAQRVLSPTSCSSWPRSQPRLNVCGWGRHFFIWRQVLAAWQSCDYPHRPVVALAAAKRTWQQAGERRMSKESQSRSELFSLVQSCDPLRSSWWTEMPRVVSGPLLAAGIDRTVIVRMPWGCLGDALEMPASPACFPVLTIVCTRELTQLITCQGANKKKLNAGSIVFLALRHSPETANT